MPVANPETYRTISASSTAELRERGSRFLAFVEPVGSAAEARAFLQRLRAEHPKAAHHCLAYRIGPGGDDWRASDDGEPSGSAGRPILAAIDGTGMTNAAVCVVRYFGGTLLGVPGLIAAYRGVAAQALEAAGVVEKAVEVLVDVECDYGALGLVLHALKSAGAAIYAQDQGLFCAIRAGIPKSVADAGVAQLSDLRGVVVRPVSNGA